MKKFNALGFLPKNTSFFVEKSGQTYFNEEYSSTQVINERFFVPNQVWWVSIFCDIMKWFNLRPSRFTEPIQLGTFTLCRVLLSFGQRQLPLSGVHKEKWDILEEKPNQQKSNEHTNN